MSTADPAPNSDAHLTSLSMLHRLQEQDAEAWRRFVDLYGPLVFSWLRRTGLPGDDAADLLQDVFLRVSRSIGQFQKRPDGTFRGWLSTIAANRVREYFRHRKDAPVASGGTEAHLRLQEVAVEEPADPSDAGSTDSLLHRGLELVRGDFEERTWQAFWRCTVEGYAAADVAADLGMSADGVYQAKARVLRRLREELGDLLE